MQAGRLRHRVAIERPVSTRDDFGGVVESWQTVATVWAEIHPLSGREFLAAQSTQAGVTTRITIRHLPGVTAAMRVNHDGTLYNIRAVLPDPTLVRHIALMCETGIIKD
jgi:SPP1 family predicted phage head-tail adaptor